MDDPVKDGEREVPEQVTGKKPYTAPSFRFESVLEVSALTCGKVFDSQSSCVHSRKVS